jgi:TrmH family RNA methyltransferase
MSAAVLTSRDNPWIKQCRALAQDSTAYRKVGEVWLEGDHLCRAWLARGRRPLVVVVAQSCPALAADWPGLDGVPRVVVADRLLAWISGLESPPPVAFRVSLPAAADFQPGSQAGSQAGLRAGLRAGLPTVVLDRLQDPGNVGSILRSAAAMGFQQVVALKGTVAIWSPKVVRAGMGAHFGLHLCEGAAIDDMPQLAVPLLATSSHQGQWLHQARLPWPCAWLLGHEGQGVAQPLLAQAGHRIRIAQPGGEESLNVAAAAAICLHASALSASSALNALAQPGTG